MTDLMDNFLQSLDHETLFLALVTGLLAAFAELVYGMVSFGPAILLTVGWQVLHLFGIGSGSIADSLVSIICMETISCLCQSVLLFEHADTKLILHNTIPRCLFSMFGTYLLFTVEEVWLKRAAGALMLLIACWRMVAHILAKDLTVLFKLEGWPMMISLFFANALSGISRGIFGIAGPPLMVFLTFYPFDKDTWRGSDAFVKIFTSINQIVYLTYTHEQFELSSWPIYFACAVGGIGGLFIGNFLSRFVNPQNFQRFLLLLLFYSGLLLWASGYPDLQLIVCCFVAISSICFLTYLCATQSCETCTRAIHRLSGSKFDEDLEARLSSDSSSTDPMAEIKMDIFTEKKFALSA